MKAVILVGGEGTRLRPLTCNTPKAIVPILNQPFLEHLIRYLKKHGITEVILAMGYLPDPIQECLGDGSRLGAQVRYVTEDSPLGTAGAVKNAEPYLDEPFVVFNGDILTEIDLTAMVKRHQETRSRASITNMINAGIYILEPEILAQIPTSTRSMFERDIFPSLLDKGESILGYPSDAYWIDIGTPEKYLKAHHDLLLNQGNSHIQTEGESQIHQTATIEGPVLIAEGCAIAEDTRIKGPAVLGQGCRINNGAIIEGGVLWNGVNIGKKAELRVCVVGSGSQIQERCHIPEGCVLGDNVRVESGLKMANATRVEPDTCLS